MPSIEQLRLMLLVDSKQGVAGLRQFGSTAEKELGRSQKAMGAVDTRAVKLGNSFKTAAAGLVGAFATGQVVQFADEMLSLNSQMASWEQKANTVFESAAGSVREWASANHEAFGVTAEELTGMAAKFGDLLKPMGFTSDEAARMSTEVVGLAGALSEWTGGQKSAAEVSDILASAMTGERESLKQLGIVIDENDIKSRLAAEGQSMLTGEARKQAEAVATQALIFERSTDAQEAYAAGGNKALRAQNELKAAVAEFKQELAEGLGPAFAGIIEQLGEFRNIVEAVTAPLSGMSVNLAENADKLKKHDEELAKLAESNPEAAFEKLTKAAELLGVPVDELRNNLPLYRAEVEATKGESESFSDAVSRTKDALDNESLAAQASTLALEAYEEQLKSLTGAHITEFEAATQWGDAIAGMTASLGENGLTLDANTEAGRANREAITRSAEAAIGHAEAVGRETGSVTEANGVLAAHVGQLRGVLRQSGLTEAQVESYIAQLGLTPKNISTAVGVTGVRSALSLLDSVQTRIRQLDGSVANVRVNARATSTGRIGGVPIFQHGGVADWTRGEHRLALIAGGETVLPTHQQYGVPISGGGGGRATTHVTNVHVHVAGSVIAERELIGVINRQLDNGARIGPHGRRL
jgi:hypothetical protein